MKRFLNLIFLVITMLPALAQSDIKNKQLKFERVRNAYDEKWTALQTDLKKAGLGGKIEICITAYKTEGVLELWIKNKKHQFTLFKTYNFCSHSGTLGPKVKENDGQTPEGCYYINVLNPVSTYHLSLGLNYPNAVDKLRSGEQRPGSDIYIHGNCVTIGCIPLTDEKIKEVYVLAVEAQDGGQSKIPVFIFPFKMTSANMNKYITQFPAQQIFWKNLQPAYDYFKAHKKLPAVSELEGKYVFK
ncbi:L,D-transpeptidase family protein [Pedobacter metabolipauper]|uniref:L,D-transpeptidase-like protein n=1 Tax=Pedobacter metabolipauper TaxID=425513 RepID=A0A4R6STY5_9SPHI|nr:L,D-transpeptidase family protein [Pedobacter metabolipauper]TDQ07534.1 L,D-transpeptidase-like protein [Pedobacter metabolipauper]